MKTSIIFLVILTVCLQTTNVLADDKNNVITVYFMGSTMNSDYWKKSGNKIFDGPETISTLHQSQKIGELADGSVHYKSILQGFPGLLLDSHNQWQAKTVEAARKVKHFIDTEESLNCTEKCITLNLVGSSRGGISTMHFAWYIQNVDIHNRYPEVFKPIKAMINKINIIAFDPVPGSAINMKFFNLPQDTSYFGFYANDERSAQFGPVFPNRSPWPHDLPYHILLVPGSHETMVGSAKIDGHYHNDTLFSIGYKASEESLYQVSQTLKIITTEIMESSDWGHIRFELQNDQSDDSAWNDRLNLNWYEDFIWEDDELKLVKLEQNFNIEIEAASDFDNEKYTNMRKYGFVLGSLEGWFHDSPPCKNYGSSNIANTARCAIGLPNYMSEYNSEVVDTVLFLPPPKYLTSLYLMGEYLNRPLENLETYWIWSYILNNGSLDVDGDFNDYSDDNCPETFNPEQLDRDKDTDHEDGIGDACDEDYDNDGVLDEFDNCPLIANENQANFDGDGIGDACDDDDDNDGVLDESDACPFTPLGEVVDPNNGCSLNQLVPCEGPRGSDEPWRNHGQYVSTFTKVAQDFVKMGLLSNKEKGAIVSAAARAICGNVKPVLSNPIPDQVATEKAPFSFTIAQDTFTDADEIDVLTYSAALTDGSDLPSWLLFDASMLRFSGTPTSDDIGAYDIRVSVNDGKSDLDVFDDFSIEVSSAQVVTPPAPVSNPSSGSGSSGLLSLFVIFMTLFTRRKIG